MRFGGGMTLYDTICIKQWRLGFFGGHPVLPVQYYVVLAIVGHGKARFMSNFIRL